jgi:hypothetical protein
MGKLGRNGNDRSDDWLSKEIRGSLDKILQKNGGRFSDCDGKMLRAPVQLIRRRSSKTGKGAG